MPLSRIASLVAVLAFSGPVWAFPAHAADTPVDLELVLTADVSRSIDAAEFQLQRQGYAQAFRDKRVIDAIRGGSFQRIAVVFVEWTGPEMQKVIIDWSLIDGPDNAETFSEKLLELPRSFSFGGGTAVGDALFHAATLFANNGFESERHVVDISGDGRVNRGRPASQGRDAAVSQGIVINGLPILGTEPQLDVYYESQVIGGPGAFSVPAEGFEDFADAVLHKLIREIAAAKPVTDTLLAARPE